MNLFGIVLLTFVLVVKAPEIYAQSVRVCKPSDIQLTTLNQCYNQIVQTSGASSLKSLENIVDIATTMKVNACYREKAQIIENGLFNLAMKIKDINSMNSDESMKDELKKLTQECANKFSTAEEIIQCIDKGSEQICDVAVFMKQTK